MWREALRNSKSEENSRPSNFCVCPSGCRSWEGQRSRRVWWNARATGAFGWITFMRVRRRQKCGKKEDFSWRTCLSKLQRSKWNRWWCWLIDPARTVGGPAWIYPSYGSFRSSRKHAPALKTLFWFESLQPARRWGIDGFDLIWCQMLSGMLEHGKAGIITARACSGNS